MSIRHVVSAALLGTALAAGSASAQFPVHFGLAAGATIPTSPLSDAVQTGYHGTALVDFSMPLSPVGLRIDGTYSKFGGKDNVLGVTGTHADYNLWNVDANVVLAVPGMIVAHPYAIAGVGYYGGKDDVSAAKYTKKVGYNAGVGIKLGLAGFGAFAEARYHYVPSFAGSSTDALKFVPISFGIMF